jgi:hypothetical protein
MIKIDYTLHAQLLRTKVLKETIKTFVLVELLELRDDFIEHGEVR